MDVVGLGCSCIDILEVVSRIPGADEELEAIETIYQGGGEVATALLVLAELGSSTGYSLIF